jgi:doubled CXXCH motif protein
MRRFTTVLIAALTPIALCACHPDEDVRAAPLLDAIHVTIDSATAAKRAAMEPGMLAAVRAVPVTGFTGPGGKPFEVALRSAVPETGHARQFGRIALSVSLRDHSASLNQYPCTSCHAGTTVTMAAQRVKDAHQNIRPVHPRRVGADCATCHAPQNVEQLVLRRGQRVGMDESYRLCAECHTKQAESWAGGGHGKRLDGWEGRRVVMSCADCHDPHDPSVKQRVPFRAPRIERARSNEP